LAAEAPVFLKRGRGGGGKGTAFESPGPLALEEQFLTKMAPPVWAYKAFLAPIDSPVEVRKKEEGRNAFMDGVDPGAVGRMVWGPAPICSGPHESNR